MKEKAFQRQVHVDLFWEEKYNRGFTFKFCCFGNNDLAVSPFIRVKLWGYRCQQNPSREKNGEWYTGNIWDLRYFCVWLRYADSVSNIVVCLLTTASDSNPQPGEQDKNTRIFNKPYKIRLIIHIATPLNTTCAKNLYDHVNMNENQ